MKRVLTVSALALLLGCSIAAQWGLHGIRPATGSTIAEGAFAAFGGFRSILSEVVWMRADRLQDEGRYVELAQLAHALTLSEPHTPEVWSYAAWNLAYNVSVMMPTMADRWRWVDQAMRLLRDDGLRLNPHSGELYRELAMLFEFKLGLDIDDAAPLYREKWHALVADVERRNAWAELGMSPAKIEETKKASGIADVASPFFSAVYWAREGLPYANRNDHAFLMEVIRQSEHLARENAHENTPLAR